MINKQNEHIEEEERNKKVLLLSVIVHVTVLLLLFLPWFNGLANEEPEPLEGIIVDLSYTNEGKGEEVMEPTTPVNKPKVEKPKPTPAKESIKKVSPSPKPVPAPAVESKTVVDDELSIAAEKARKEKEARREKELAEKRQAELEAKRKAEEERQKKEAYEQSKSKFSDLFKSGSSKGSSDDPDKKAGSVTGEPDAAALDRISTGKGKAGNGLGGRGIVYEPVITDKSQKTGRVVIRVCVNREGSVSNAKFTQKGSTTTDSYLVNLAVKNAKKYRFTKSDIEEQCGDISIDFKLK